MLDRFLKASSILALLLVSSVPAIAQPQPKPLIAQTPASPQTAVSSDELQKFAKAIERLMALEQESRTQIAQAIQSQGFSEERFQEILQAQQNPSEQSGSNISAEEQQKFEEVIKQAADIQQKIETKQKQAVQDQGLELKRFTEILTAIRQNPQLKEQVQQLLQK